MKKYILIALTAILTLGGCNNGKSELQKIAKSRLDSISLKVQNLGGSCTHHHMIENDSICLYSSTISYPNMREINAENYYIRIKEDNESVYYENSRVSIGDILLSDEVLKSLYLVGLPINDILKDKEKMKLFCDKAYEIAYRDCLKRGQKINLER